MSATSRSRREARERALELLYEAQSKAEPVADVVATLPVAPDAYAVELATGVEREGPQLDDYITRHVRGWTIERLPVIDRMVLRLAIFELQQRLDVPAAVVINEAVDLAKQYSTEESGRFVNGMLSAITRELRESEALDRDRRRQAERSDVDPDPAPVDGDAPDPAS